MRTLWRFTLLWSLLLGVTMAHAQTARFHLLGLSADGQFLAFEVYGIIDATNHPLSEIYFVNTEKNSYAAPMIAVRGDRDEPDKNMVAEVRRSTLQQAMPVLQSLNITPGDTGISDAPFRRTNTELSLVTFGLAKGLPERKIELTLREIPMQAEWKTCKQGTKGIALSLSAQNAKGDTTKTVLQNDTKVPESRLCPVSYQIEDAVFSEHGHIIVVLSYRNAFPNLIGHTLDYMVVTGQIK